LIRVRSVGSIRHQRHRLTKDFVKRMSVASPALTTAQALLVAKGLSSSSYFTTQFPAPEEKVVVADAPAEPVHDCKTRYADREVAAWSLAEYRSLVVGVEDMGRAVHGQTQGTLMRLVGRHLSVKRVAQLFATDVAVVHHARRGIDGGGIAGAGMASLDDPVGSRYTRGTSRARQPTMLVNASFDVLDGNGILQYSSGDVAYASGRRFVYNTEEGLYYDSVRGEWAQVIQRVIVKNPLELQSARRVDHEHRTALQRNLVVFADCGGLKAPVMQYRREVRADSATARLAVEEAQHAVRLREQNIVRGDPNADIDDDSWGGANGVCFGPNSELLSEPHPYGMPDMEPSEPEDDSGKLWGSTTEEHQRLSELSRTHLRPIGVHAFRRVLAVLKEQGTHISFRKVGRYCVVCKQLPGKRTELALMRAKLTAGVLSVGEKIALAKKVGELEGVVARGDLHTAWLGSQTFHLANVKLGLAQHPGVKRMLWMDYGKFYNSDGSKVKVLGISSYYYNLGNDKLQYSHVNAFFRGSSCATAAVYILGRLMDQKLLVGDFTDLTICSDTGNGFRGQQLGSFFCEWGEKYNVTVRQCLGVPHHAANCVDGRISTINCIVRRYLVNANLYTPMQYCYVNRLSTLTKDRTNTDSYYFNKVMLKQSKSSADSLRKTIGWMGYLNFDYTLNLQHGTTGLVRKRSMAEAGHWELLDLRRGRKTCNICRDVGVFALKTAHKPSKCPNKQVAASIVSDFQTIDELPYNETSSSSDSDADYVEDVKGRGDDDSDDGGMAVDHGEGIEPIHSEGDADVSDYSGTDELTGINSLTGCLIILGLCLIHVWCIYTDMCKRKRIYVDLHTTMNMFIRVGAASDGDGGDQVGEGNAASGISSIRLVCVP
jgi:hypothetical protein